MEKGYIIFSHEKRTKSRKMSPKTQVTADRLVQMFRVSHTADYYNWADVFQVFSWGMHVTTMEELERLMMRNSNVNYFDYFPVSCDGVGSVGMHQLNYNNLQYDLLEIFVPISPLPPAFFSSSFYSSFSFSWEKNIIFLYCSKIETDLKKQMTATARESIVGFHMVSLKFKL